MSCECYHIGKFIGADPDCPIHNKDHPDYVDRDELERLRAEVVTLRNATVNAGRLRELLREARPYLNGLGRGEAGCRSA